MLNDFNTLSKQGNLAFYESCEITQVFIHRKSDRTNTNLITVAVFENDVLPESGKEEIYLTTKPVAINNDYNFGIIRYWVNIDEARNTFNELLTVGKWKHNDDHSLGLGKLRPILKQFVPSDDRNLINSILKNNFYSGSYILEYFDESKDRFDWLLPKEHLGMFNTMCESIKQYVPIDLSIMRDRVGNIIFQFPINILNVKSSASNTWDKIDFEFTWDNRIRNIPDCLIEVVAEYDNNYMGATLMDYNKQANQQVVLGNLDMVEHVKIWRKEINLVLSVFNGTYIRDFALEVSLINPEPRLFEINKKVVEVSLVNFDKPAVNRKIEYDNFISSRLYDVEREQLMRSLAFKQYGKGIDQIDEPVNDLRKLIGTYGKNGVYLWDPFLSPVDIMETLYYSPFVDTPLKAIGAINAVVIQIYKTGNSKFYEKLCRILCKTLGDLILLITSLLGNRYQKAQHDIKGLVFKYLSDHIDIPEMMKRYKRVFENPANNNVGLNLEFRCQHSKYGWQFHDRFLMFPGDNSRPKVYSLGTSVNSFGNNHHIIHEVSHPQMVIDAFNDLWDKLDDQECIVWKSMTK